MNCEYDQFKYPFFIGDVNAEITVEARLAIPENTPKIATIIGGDFRVGPPSFSVIEDGLVISGQIYPDLLFIADQGHRPGAVRDDHSEDRDEAELPPEYGMSWPNEDGIRYEDKIEVPGLRPGMLVWVEAAPLTGTFEKNGFDSVVFRGVIEVTVHAAYHQAAGVVGDISISGPEKINITREQVMVEELLGTKRVSLPVQANLMLPNIKPGIARILKTVVHPSNITQEMGRNRLFVKGILEITVIYVGSDEEGNPSEIFANEWSRDLGSAIPFETHIDLDESQDELTAVTRVTAGKIVIEPRNPHELRCQVDLEVEAGISAFPRKEMVVDATPGDNELLDTQKYLLNLEEYAGEVSGVIDLEQQLELPSSSGSMERILACQGAPREVTVEAADGKVLVEGAFDLRVMYMADSNESRRLSIASWEKAKSNSLSLAGIIEFPGLQAGTLLRAHLILDSMRMEMLDSRNLRLTGEVKMRVFARTPRAIFVLKDFAVVTPVDPATRPSMLFYVAQPEDTLWKIARRYQTTVDTLAKANQISNPDLLAVGQKLLIPKRIAGM